MKNICRVKCLLALALCLLGAGCETTAINKDRTTTLLESDDMIDMTNRMAQSMIGDTRIQGAWRTGALKIVIKPVMNSTNEIILDSDAQLYVARLKSLLATKPELHDRFIWCINRADYDKLRAQEIPESKLGEPEGRIVPEYALYAEFYSDDRVTRDKRSTSYLCVYKLTRISGGIEGAELWNGQYETSKAMKRGFLD